jgi:hypothetical protein
MLITTIPAMPSGGIYELKLREGELLSSIPLLK